MIETVTVFSCATRGSETGITRIVRANQKLLLNTHQKRDRTPMRPDQRSFLFGSNIERANSELSM